MVGDNILGPLAPFIATGAVTVIGFGIIFWLNRAAERESARPYPTRDGLLGDWSAVPTVDVPRDFHEPSSATRKDQYVA